MRVGLLSVPGVAANVRGRDARAKTKLSLKPEGIQTQLRHTSMAGGLLQTERLLSDT